MIIEGLAQAGGVLAFQSASDKEQKDIENKVVYFMSIDRAKFRLPVTPVINLYTKSMLLDIEAESGI